MPDPEVLWRSGDPWRVLTSDVGSHPSVTVVSRSGTARFLDLERGRHDRQPLEGGHVMRFDAAWRPLAEFWLTPCGLNVFGPFDWAMGTPIWIAITGIHPDWSTSEWGRPIVDAIITRQRPTAPGHPNRRCGALHCPPEPPPGPGPASGNESAP